MRDHYGLAQRTSDDGTLMHAPINPTIPKLSLWGPQAQAPEQELGQPSRRALGQSVVVAHQAPIAAISASRGAPRTASSRGRRCV